MTTPKKKTAKKATKKKAAKKPLNKSPKKERDAKGRLLPGHKGGPGRPKGSPNLSKRVMAAFEKDAEKNGEDFVSFMFRIARGAAFDPETRQARDITAGFVSKLIKVETVTEENEAQAVRLFRVVEAKK